MSKISLEKDNIRAFFSKYEKSYFSYFHFLRKFSRIFSKKIAQNSHKNGEAEK